MYPPAFFGCFLVNSQWLQITLIFFHQIKVNNFWSHTVYRRVCNKFLDRTIFLKRFNNFQRYFMIIWTIYALLSLSNHASRLMLLASWNGGNYWARLYMPRLTKLWPNLVQIHPVNKTIFQTMYIDVRMLERIIWVTNRFHVCRGSYLIPVAQMSLGRPLYVQPPQNQLVV